MDPPLRVSVIGLDGAGKSSTTLRAIARLAPDFTLVKPGRDPFVIAGAHRQMCLPRTSRFFERLFKRVDLTRRRGLIGATRLAFIRYQGWLEPHLVARHDPDIVLTTRCMIIDPAIYGELYAPALSRVPLERRLRAFRRYSGLEFRDLYLLLRTPPPVAMDRIHLRIAAAAGGAPGPRDHWLHLHEQESVLRTLARRFDDALEVARRIAPLRIEEIDTEKHDEAEVAERIDAAVRRALRERSP